MFQKFWNWYERNYALYISVATFFFLLQFFHLFWLFGEVIWDKLFGVSLFEFSGLWQYLIIAVDYLEVPSLCVVMFAYFADFRKTRSIKNIFYIFLLATQFLHIFWITDEFVVGAFQGHSLVTLSPWLAWVAILIDYLEVPVIFDITRKSIRALRETKEKRFEALVGAFRAK